MDLKISERMWGRKQKIAELMLLDEDRFQRVLLESTEPGVRLNQQVLSNNCRKVLNSAEFKQKRSRAIAAGKLI